MTRPDPAAVATAILGGIGTALIAWTGWRAGAIACAGITLAAVLALWRVPLCDQDGNDIEALIRATRDDIPDYVPDEWTEECR